MRPYPGPGAKVKVSTTGGSRPAWNPNGREIFYISDRGLHAAPVRTEPDLVVGRSELLFGREQSWSDYFTVSQDGQRFLFARYVEEKKLPRQMVYVPNWFDELESILAGPSN